MINALRLQAMTGIRLAYVTSVYPRCRVIFGLLVGLCLSACSNLPQQATTPSSFVANDEIQRWQLRGKIGFRDNQQAQSAYINWVQCDERYHISLTGPLGQRAAQLASNGQQVSLTTSDQQVFHADSAEQLIAEHIGWSFPVEQLFYWIRGIPAPEQSLQPLNIQDNNQLIGFQQSQWQLHFPRATLVDSFQLPTKITAQRTPLKVTLLVKKWQLQPDCNDEPTAT
jgi:outer membrane lipoprotein LolB